MNQVKRMDVADFMVLIGLVMLVSAAYQAWGQWVALAALGLFMVVAGVAVALQRAARL